MYVSKVIESIERKVIDERKLRAAIGDSYLWLDRLLYPLEIEVLRQVKELDGSGQKAEAYKRIKKLGILAAAMGISKRTGSVKKPICDSLTDEEEDGTER